VTTTSAAVKRRTSAEQRRDRLTGYAFVAPAALLITIFGLFPIGYAIYMSLFRWRIRQGRFVGFDNYADVVGDGWGALAFFGGLLLIMAAHWLWADAFNRGEDGAGAIGKVLGSVVLLGSGVAIALGWGLMKESGDGRFLDGLERTVCYG